VGCAWLGSTPPAPAAHTGKPQCAGTTWSSFFRATVNLEGKIDFSLKTMFVILQRGPPTLAAGAIGLRQPEELAHHRASPYHRGRNDHVLFRPREN